MTEWIAKMREFFVSFGNLVQWWDLVDIAILACAIYQLIKLTRETQASRVLKGFGVVIVVAQVSQWLRLTALAQILSYVMTSSALLLAILFQPEIRKALQRLGEGRILDRSFLHLSNDEEIDNPKIGDEILYAVQNMAKKRVGALIAIQRENTLDSIIESGTVIDALVTKELLENLFVPNTPLHDGAVIINGTRVVAAGCFLPLTSNAGLSQELGTRHRAALGMSENTDALVLVVSEETGIISMAEGGRLQRYLDFPGLKELLDQIYSPDKQNQRGLGLNVLIKWRNRGNDKTE